MPFVVPRVLVYDRAGATAPVNVVESDAAPDKDVIISYVEWLRDEIAVAKAAYETQTGEKWIEEDRP